jgi:hypothetical protein
VGFGNRGLLIIILLKPAVYVALLDTVYLIINFEPLHRVPGNLLHVMLGILKKPIEKSFNKVLLLFYGIHYVPRLLMITLYINYIMAVKK